MTCGSGVRSGMAATIPPGRAEPFERSCVIVGSRWACQEDTAPGGMLDITELILDDHREQRRLFAILEQIDRADTGVLSAIWDRLASFLELHAAAGSTGS